MAQPDNKRRDRDGEDYTPGQTETPGRKKRRSEGAADFNRRVSRPRRMFQIRLILLMAVFCLVCGVYAVRLMTLQVEGNAYSVFSPADVPVGVETRTVVLCAPRGDIYDRNGTPLVTSVSSYAVTLDYDGLYSLGGHAQRNRVLLRVLAGIDAAVRNEPEGGITPAVQVTPFEGTYPSLRYAEEVETEISTLGKVHREVLAFLGLREGTSSAALVQYYVKMYELDGHVDGIPLYSDEEIDRLIRIYYDMDRLAFAPGTSYALVSCESEGLINMLRGLSVPGLRVESTLSRVYHYPGYASHVLGEVTSLAMDGEREYCNALGYPTNATAGKSGCESAFNDTLRGTDGEMELTLDATGRVLDRRVTVEPIPGRDVYLTIDIDVQMAAEDALRVNVATVAYNGTAGQGADCDAGAVIALDSATGAILALGSYPTFDLSLLASERAQLERDDTTPLLNRALMATYTPSTLYTLCTATAGLDLGVITASERLRDMGQFITGTAVLECPLYRDFGESHGSLSVVTALQDGCEVFFAQLGGSMDAKLLNYYGEDMGLGQKTGVELPESTGVLAGPAYRALAGLAPWTPSMTPAAAVGLSDNACTPIQLATMVSSLLTQGDRYETHLFHEAHSYVSGDVLEQHRSVLQAQMDLYEKDTSLLLGALQDKAMANALLWEKTAEVRASGVSVGYLGAQSFSTTFNSEDALCVAFGDDGEGNAISICVVLEHGANAELTAPTVAAVMEAWFLEK